MENPSAGLEPPHSKKVPAHLEEHILSQIRRTRAVTRKKGIVGFVATFVLAALGYGLDWEPIWMLLLVIAGLCSLLRVIPSLLNPDEAKPFRLLRTRAADIVWLYAAGVRGLVNKNYIMCGLDDGVMVQLPCELGQEQHLLNELARFVPEATRGFSEGLLAKFREDAQSLRAQRLGR